MATPPPPARRWASLADRLNPNRPSLFDPNLKASWKSLPKSERQRIIAEDKRAIRELKARGAGALPFAADPNDHCETSPVAYAHVAPVLHAIAKCLGKAPAELEIYDPYFCAGAAVQHLNKLGFGQVHNKCEDFYEVIKQKRVPAHDVVVTNPPYSGDHFDRLLQFLSSNRKPALLLLPEHFSQSKSPLYSPDDFCFLAPPERYHYWTPEGMRPEQQSKKRKQHKNLVLGSRNSPFFSHWFIDMEPVMPNNEFISMVERGVVKLIEGCRVHARQDDIAPTTIEQCTSALQREDDKPYFDAIEQGTVVTLVTALPPQYNKGGWRCHAKSTSAASGEVGECLQANQAADMSCIKCQSPKPNLRAEYLYLRLLPRGLRRQRREFERIIRDADGELNRCDAAESEANERIAAVEANADGDGEELMMKVDLVQRGVWQSVDARSLLPILAERKSALNNKLSGARAELAIMVQAAFDLAVIHAQRLARRFLVRLRLDEIRQSVRDFARFAAAVEIQRIVRSKLACLEADRLRTLRDLFMATKIQSAARRRFAVLERKRLFAIYLEKRRNQCATTIQSMVRCMQCKMQAAKLAEEKRRRLEEQEKERQESLKEDSAIVIQKHCRRILDTAKCANRRIELGLHSRLLMYMERYAVDGCLFSFVKSINDDYLRYERTIRHTIEREEKMAKTFVEKVVNARDGDHQRSWESYLSLQASGVENAGPKAKKKPPRNDKQEPKSHERGQVKAKSGQGSTDDPHEKALTSLERTKDRLRGQYLRFDIPNGLDDTVARFIMAVTLRYKCEAPGESSLQHGGFERPPVDKGHYQKCTEYAEPLIQKLHGDGIVFIRDLLPEKMARTLSSLGVSSEFVVLSHSLLNVLRQMSARENGESAEPSAKCNEEEEKSELGRALHGQAKMAESQSPEIYTEPPMDVTTEMMSPATSAMLANMNVSVMASAARGHADASNDRSRESSFLAPAAPERRPLGDVYNHHDAPTSKGNRRRQNSKRAMGPNEQNYRENYDAFVTKAIARYSARTQTNLRHDTLPNYRGMNASERKSAMDDVDKLLERLSGVDLDAPIESALGEGAGHTQSTATTLGSGGRKTNETFGSATTLGEGRHNETFGSATTLGGGEPSLFATASTPGEEPAGSVRQSTGSATTLGNNKSLANDTTILEESMILLSDDEIGGGNNNDEEESRFSGGDDRERKGGHHQKGKQRSPGAAPIERTRHYQHPHQSTSLALDDEMLESTPPLSNNRLASKRCASNSGKRGLKSRHRGSHDGDESLLGHFSGIGGGDSGMLLHDQEDAFSCGSPIQRQFSHDEYDDEMRDSVHDLPEGKQRGKSHGMHEEESEGGSRFSYQGDDDNVSFGGGNDGFDDYEEDGGDWNLTEQPKGTQNPMSQWSTFRNADAEFTASQMDGDDDEDESPVRRRAIHFEGTSKKATSKKALKSQRKSQRSDMKGADEEMAVDAERGQAKKSSQKKASKDGEDPVETVRNLCRRAKAVDEQGGDSLEEVAPIDVRLRDGMQYRVDPLRCKQNKKGKTAKKAKSVSIADPRGRGTGGASSDSENSLSDPEPSFKDPLTDYSSRVRARLNAGLNFLLEKEEQQTLGDEEADNQASAALLSLSSRQIVGVTSKLLQQTKNSARLHARSKNKPSSAKRFTPSSHARPKDDDYFAGGTLIVLRGKEDIDEWEAGLREFTGLSVLNHAGMSSGQRKLDNTAGKCSTFDVVLSTYDAIKTKEVVVPVDSSGCAILGGSNKSSSPDGWLTARDAGTQSGAAAPQKCHQLSLLHRMSWFRVIFIDVLGRKGFLTKQGTARAQAAVAVNAKSRFALFQKDEDAKKAEAKFKDNRRELRAIIAALHLPERMKLDKLVGSYILDVDQVGKGKEADEGYSSSEDEYISDEEEEEDLTEP
ncbi:hypothetical protein ACHAXT_009404 [Thalassiosira profunda]